MRRMRAVQADATGGLDVLTLREVDAPEPKPGHVLVRTVASTINPLDRKMRAKDLAFPITLGCDVGGVVVVSDVPDFRPGDRVMAMTTPRDESGGAWADFILLAPDQLARAPETVSLGEAATVPLAGLTALQAWNAVGVATGSRVLVAGAAGGVGGFAVQLAVQAGMVVDALVSRPELVGAAQELGARLVVTDPAALPAHVYGAVVDPIGMPAKGIDVGELMLPAARYVVVGSDQSGLSGAHEVTVEDDAAGLRQLAALVDAGAIRLRVAGQFPLQEFRAAHQLFEGGGLAGKVVLYL